MAVLYFILLSFPGVGMAQRMLAKAATPSLNITVEGDKITIVSTGLQDLTTVIVLGQEKEETTVDGRKAKVYIQQ